MLLSWTKRVRIAVCPDHIVAVTLHGRSGKVLDSQIRPCVAMPQDDKNYAAALRLLAQWAAELRTEGRADVSMVLSNHFVDYALVPWDALIAGETEARAHASQFFASDDLALRHSECGQAGVRLVSALDNACLTGVRAALQGEGLKLSSVQPYWMAAFNHCQPQLKQADGWFVLIEAGRACLVRLQQGGWQHLRSVRVGADWQAALPQLLQRESRLLGEDGQRGTVWVFEPHSMNKPWSPQDGWHYHSLSLASSPLYGLDITADCLMAAMG